MLVPQLILCITSGFLMVKFISSSKGRGFGFQKKKKPISVSWPNCKEKSSWSECVYKKILCIMCWRYNAPTLLKNLAPLMCGNGCRRGEIT